MKYTDIGHGHPNDILWLIQHGDLCFLPAGLDRTHELVWGGDCKIEDYWRGRVEAATLRCSITPPADQLGYCPADAILGRLRKRFGVKTFYYFGGGREDAEPVLFDAQVFKDPLID